METLIKLAPHIMAFFSLVLGGAFFKFVLDVLKWTKRNRLEKDLQDRLYEIAFRRCDAYTKSVIQYAVAVAAAQYGDNPALVKPYLLILCRVLGSVDETTGKWTMNPYPNFLQEARDEIALLEQSLEDESEA